MLSCENCEIFKTPFFTGHLRCLFLTFAQGNWVTVHSSLSATTYFSQSVEFMGDTLKLMHCKDLRTDMHVGLVRSGTKKFYLHHIYRDLVNPDFVFLCLKCKGLFTTIKTIWIFIRLEISLWKAAPFVLCAIWQIRERNFVHQATW